MRTCSHGHSLSSCQYLYSDRTHLIWFPRNMNWNFDLNELRHELVFHVRLYMILSLVVWCRMGLIHFAVTWVFFHITLELTTPAYPGATAISMAQPACGDSYGIANHIEC